MRTSARGAELLARPLPLASASPRFGAGRRAGRSEGDPAPFGPAPARPEWSRVAVASSLGPRLRVLVGLSRVARHPTKGAGVVCQRGPPRPSFRQQTGLTLAIESQASENGREPPSLAPEVLRVHWDRAKASNSEPQPLLPCEPAASANTRKSGSVCRPGSRPSLRVRRGGTRRRRRSRLRAARGGDY